ncbi:hypothetical protein Hanom_Chr04g00302631 [Helianthus anomalus]
MEADDCMSSDAEEDHYCSDRDSLDDVLKNEESDSKWASPKDCSSKVRRVGRGCGKTLDHVCLGKMTHIGSMSFFNEMASKKQTVCRAKRLRVVCVF